jgi:hypothetical protein
LALLLFVLFALIRMLRRRSGADIGWRAWGDDLFRAIAGKAFMIRLAGCD